MTLEELQKNHEEFEKEFWVAPKGLDEQTRHIVLHLAKLIGKVGAVSEQYEHGFDPDKEVVKKEVIPDLLYYAFALSTLYDVDLEKSFLDRLEANKKKISSWKNRSTTTAT